VTTTASTTPAFAAWSSASFDAAAASNPSHAHTEKVGGKVQFENDNYRITAGDDNTVDIYNKNTGESYQVWGDPHVKIDGTQAFDFWGTTTFQLDDGTKVTINTTPWANNPNATLASKVTITNGNYGVQITGVDSNRTGDLAFEEAKGLGRLADWAVPDGNTIHENPFGSGFLGVDSKGRLRQVDQQYINETDLTKGGALQAQAQEALKQLAGLIAVSFVGSFLAGLAAGLDGASGDSPRSTATSAGADFNVGFALFVSRNGANANGFASTSAWQG
jgi:hypothetical protein